MRFLSASIITTAAVVWSAPAAAQTTTLTASFTKGAIAEHSGNANRTDNGRVFSSLGITSMSISQLSNNGTWGGSQGNDYAITAKINFSNGTTTSFPAAINWVKNAGGGGYDWIGITIGAGTTVNDGYNLTAGMQKTYILAFPQSTLDLSTLTPADFDGSANTGQAVAALNQYFPTALASPPVITGPTGGAGAAASALSVNENQTAVTTLTANKAVSWAITGGTDASRFAISAGGVVTYLASPDFENPTDSDGNNTYVLTVQATDSNGGTSTQTITVTVLNLDDTAPVVAPNQSFSYVENQIANAPVATVAATDNVGVTAHRFSASGTQTSQDGFYTIDNAGVLRITAAGVAAGVANNDFEVSPNSFTYGVQAGDAVGNWSPVTNVSLIVTNLDDTAPAITGGQSFSYAENRAPGALLGTVAASDDTGVTGFRFTATGTSTSADGFYSTDPAGRITLTAAGAAAGSATNDFEINPNSFTYGLEARDAAGNWSPSADVVLNVTNLDDSAPLVTAGQSFSYAENRTAGALLGTVAASDDTGVTGFRFTSTGTGTSSDGFYAIDASGRITLTSAGAAAGIPANDFETAPNSFTHGVQVRDAEGNWSASADVVLKVTNLDDSGPSVTASQSFSYAENRSANAVLGTVAATDDNAVTAFRFAATGTSTSADGYYSIDDSGVLRLTAAGAAAGVSANDFELSPNSFTYGVEAGDAAGNWSAAANVVLNVTDVDDTAPVIAAGQSFSYSENQAANTQVGSVAVSDAAGVTAFRFAATGTSTSQDGFYTIDSAGIIRLTVAGATAGAPSNDFESAPNSFTYGIEAGDTAGNWSATSSVTLSVTDANDSAPVIAPGQSFAYAENRSANAQVGTIAVTDDVGVTAFRFAATGTGTSADGFYTIDHAGIVRLTAAGAVSGEATNDFETAPNSFTYAVEAGDSGGNWSAATNVTFNVTDLDDTAPVVGAGQSFSYAENQSANAQVGAVAAADAVGVTAFRFAATGSSTSQDGFYTIDSSGVLRITAASVAAGTANNDFEIAPNSFFYAIEAGDAAGNWSPAIIISLNVTNLADVSPVITGPGGSTGGTSSISVPEGSTAVTQLTANVQISRWTITGGNDQGRFAIDSSGRITFVTPPDYEAPSDSDRNNSYMLTVEAEDAHGLRSTQTITINVTDLADNPPVITGPGGSTGGTSAITVDEGTTAVTQLTANVPISSWAIAGGNDHGRFVIDGAGRITFATSPDYERPSDSDGNNTYILTITATDGTGQISTQTITVTVADLPDTPPVITGPSGSTGASSVINVPEGATARIQLTANVPIASWTIVGGNDGGRFAIDGSGNITFTSSPDFERPSDSDTNNSYVLVVEAVDGNGNRSTQTVAVNVTDVADTPPVITGPGGSTGTSSSISVPEGTTAVTQVVADVPISSWSITGGNDQGRFAIDGNGNIAFVASPDYERPTDSDGNNTYILTITAIDGTGQSSTQTITVNVTDVADTGPVISGPGGSTGATSTITVNEGTTAVTTLGSNVPVTWAITGGNDGGRFTISPSGAITFVAVPDYERPSDSDTNNSYVLTVTATDSNGQVSTQTVTVAVADLSDNPPVITGPGGSTGASSSVSVPEGTTGVTTMTANVPISSWAIVGGNDQGRFNISPAGVITFVAAPDYERPTDSDTNNSYVLVIEGTDANGNRTTQTVTVNVTNVPDTPPAITGPSGDPGAVASAIAVNEGTIAVTQLTASVPVTWSIVGGNDRGQFAINAQGQLTFVAAPNFEAPADSDRNNNYVLIVEALDANSNRSTQTITVTVLNVDELQRKLDEISGNLRGDLRNQAFSSLSTMLSFNEGLLGLDGPCASAGNLRPLSGGLNANERSQEANVRFARDLSSCEARTRVFVDGGVGFSRVEGHWTTRGLASARLERLIGDKTVLGAALIGTAANDELGSFNHSRSSDRTLQLNVYGRTHLTERLRFAAFAGWGRSWYEFKLQDGGLNLDGEADGKRHLYGAALSGDFRFAGLDITTDAILSRAVEKLGSSRLDASFEGESRSNILFRLGRVDITRLSVPVHVPITFDRPTDGREATRLDISPGILCQDTSQDSSALDCGYQLGLKFRLAPSIRSLIRAEAKTEAVDGYLLNSLTVGLQRRFGSADQLAMGVDVSRQGRTEQAENRVMVRVGLGR